MARKQTGMSFRKLCSYLRCDRSACASRRRGSYTIRRMRLRRRGAGFPIVVKPNVGGSGAGVVRFDNLAAFTEAAKGGQNSLGYDHVGLVQESCRLAADTSHG